MLEIASAVNNGEFIRQAVEVVKVLALTGVCAGVSGAVIYLAETFKEKVFHTNRLDGHPGRGI